MIKTSWHNNFKIWVKSATIKIYRIKLHIKIPIKIRCLGAHTKTKMVLADTENNTAKVPVKCQWAEFQSMSYHTEGSFPCKCGKNIM